MYVSIKCKMYNEAVNFTGKLSCVVLFRQKLDIEVFMKFNMAVTSTKFINVAEY